MTATKTKPDSASEFTEAHRELDGARKTRARRGEAYRGYQQKLAQTQAELGHLARTDPDQFGEDGQPKPKSRAAELKQQLDEAGSSSWADVLAGDDERIRAAEVNVHRLTAKHAEELATAEFRAGEDDLAEGDALVEGLLRVLSRLAARRARQIANTVSCNGDIDGRHVLTDDRVDGLMRLLEQYSDFKPPRVTTLSPLVGDEPRVVKGRNGGWIGAHHGSNNYCDEQPEKLEPRR